MHIYKPMWSEGPTVPWWALCSGKRTHVPNINTPFHEPHFFTQIIYETLPRVNSSNRTMPVAACIQYVYRSTLANLHHIPQPRIDSNYGLYSLYTTTHSLAASLKWLWRGHLEEHNICSKQTANELLCPCSAELKMYLLHVLPMYIYTYNTYAHEGSICLSCVFMHAFIEDCTLTSKLPSLSVYTVRIRQGEKLHPVDIKDLQKHSKFNQCVNTLHFCWFLI